MKSKIFFITFLIITSVIFPQKDIKILSSDFRSLTVEYTPLYLDTSDVILNGNTYKNIELYLGNLENEQKWGNPYILTRSLNVGVPAEFGNTIEIISSFYKDISGKVKPVPYAVPDSSSFYYDFRENAEYYNYSADDELVSFGEFGLVRDVGAQTIEIKPIKFFPKENKIRLYKKIIFKISFSGNGQISSKPADDLVEGIFVNYNVAKFWNKQGSNNSFNKPTIVNSVLATGRWFRFETPEEGIYKITRAQLSALGIDANLVDPKTIKIYNNGGKTLPENNSLTRPIDLEENAILIVGEDDGKFDETDYILFYGRGSRFWDYGNDGITIQRFNHSYSTKNYYWITSGGAAGKRMDNKPSIVSTPTLTQTTTDAFADWEEDKINLGMSGRQWMGDNFNTSVPSRTYTNTLNGIVENSQISYKFRFIIGSTSGLTLRITENGNNIVQQNLAGYSEDYVVGKDYPINSSYSQLLPNDRSILNLSVSPSTATSVGYLDYFTITYTKKLKANGDQLTFYSTQHDGIIEYQLNNYSSSDIKTFDISDYKNVKQVTGSNLTGGECKFSSNELSSLRSKYLAVGNEGYKTVVNQVEITNSDLHGETVGARYIVVTCKDFLDAANTFKNYKENNAPVPISTYVVDIQQIYNEFSCGVQDPTALRDYLKFAYDNWQIRPQYVMLLGKGTYDYKNIENYNDNFVPTWQTEQSLIMVYYGDSYTTDDFFCRVSGTDSKPDIAIGRVTCTTPGEAGNYLNKVMDYELNQAKGDWRNLITLVSDDGYKGNKYEGNMHTEPSENLANIYFPASFSFNKIYSASYPEEITGQGKRKPLVNQAIINAVNEGTVFLNYFGHGSPELWADEHIFEKSTMVSQLQNTKYFFLGAATCDFGYFDIPNYKSAAEEITFLPNSGAIASLTAARLVFAGENEGLMYRLIDSLFSNGKDTLNYTYPIGKVIFASKTTSINDQKYHLLGDPTVRLIFPRYNAKIDSINGQNPLVNIQVSALSKTKVEGSILKSDNTVWNDFNGEGILTIFDSQRQVRIESINYNVNMQGGVIFKGRVSITDGKFSTEFVVPKDISYENKNGKIVLYFSDDDVDGLGYTNKIVVGGTDTTAVNDGTGPEINIYFDNISNVNGSLVNKDSKLIVDLKDETGINTTGTGVGHKLEGVLNQNEQNPIDFTNYFTGDLDAGGKSGKIEYQFTTLENGDNTLQVKAWDVFNNPSVEDVNFTVVEGNDLQIRDVYNYPNPFKDKTQFTFQQNLNKPIDVKIKVYSISGRLIHEIERQNISDRFVIIDWDGKDKDGDEVANGTYLYKIIVKSVDGEFNKSVLGKLAVLN